MARLLSRQRRGLVALTVLALVMSVLAIYHKGVPAAQLQLNDGGVWVINQTLRRVAHLSYPSRTLDGGVATSSDDFDLSQNADTVIVRDAGAKRAQSLDTAALVLGEGAPLASSLSLTQGGEVVAASDSEAGKVWVLDAAQIDTFSPTAEPTLDQVPGVRTIAGTDGVVHAVLPNGTVKRIAGGVTSDDGRIEGVSDLASASLTVVGDTLVVLDKAGSAVRTIKGSVHVDAAEKLVLQLPGAQSDRVLLAGDDSYLWAPLKGGDAEVIANGQGSGTPAAPAFLSGCAYLAWAGSGAYIRDCATDADDRKQTVDKLKGMTRIAFRVNRDVIVLNDMASGSVLLVNDSMRDVDNWDVVEDTAKKQDDRTNTVDTPDDTATQQKKQQTQPEAKDDEYGVRPGRSFTLPVLENDVDADGDLLTASVKEQPKGATVSQVRGGEALSIAVPDDATGVYTFAYTASDGRGGTSDARVTVTVYPDSVNAEPVQKRASAITLSQQGTVTYALLGDFRDPEGDSVFLEGVDELAGLSIKPRPDGVVTIKDLGTGGTGQKKIAVHVSDGKKTCTGFLTVNVREGKQPPVANTDHVTALKGQEVVVQPLANDVDPTGHGLRLASVDQPTAGQSIQPDYNNGTFRFTALTAVTTYIAYQVTNDSPTTATGYVRIDVSDPAEGSPVPTDDLAMLAAGGSVMVDALANDTDPAGGVLVLKSVDVPADAGMAVEIVDHHLLRVSAPAGLTGPVDVGYIVSNGTAEAKGRVTVVPLAVKSVTGPTVVDDKAIVRQGDIVTVHVLDNDLSPAGLALTLDPQVTIEGGGDAGDAFVSRDTVRFRARKAGTVRINYTVRDTQGNYATAQVVVTVNPTDLANTPPLPQPLAGRVLAGSTVSIPVVTDGIDPEGDSVTLVGLASGPTKGTAQATTDAIEYTAPAGTSGTDTFSYQVEDRFGARATAVVRVGIATPNTANQAPVAVPDEVSTRPDRSLTVNPVANDTDPDGDAVSLVAGSVSPTDDKTTIAAAASGGVVELRTPNEETTLRYYYGIEDGRGGAGKGVLSVKVSKDAVLKPPVALDDVVTSAMITESPTVEVDVLANDYDPDGSVKDLTLSTEDPGATVTNGKLTVTLTDQRQVILYSVTDVDKNTAKAAVVVPPADSSLPYLDSSKLPVKVKAGEVSAIPLADYVLVRKGRSPMLTFAEKVKAGVGADTSTTTVKDATTLEFKALQDYTGLSSVTFEVTDGKSADDSAGRVATLSIPIQVEAAAAVQHPPVFTPSEVTVAQGEGPTSVDLKGMVSDADPGDAEKLTFAKGSASAGFTVDLSGSTLKVSAPTEAQPGATGAVELTVTDGSTAPVPGTLRLKVTASTRPLMSISTVVIDDAKAGSPSTVDLSKYITNPFAAEGKPVTLTGQPTANPSGAGIDANGLVVTITPPANYHGQLVVNYTAEDATKTASRQVRGTIQLTVRDKPDPPTAVTAETHLSKTVTVSWSAGANNGAPIEKFTVHWSGGSKDCGAATNCLIDTLQNDTLYTFTVTAWNAVGESSSSDPSNQVRPDVKPDPPGTPVGTFGDKQIALTWPAAKTDGSPVKSYTVRVSPGGTTQETAGTSLTWTGLTNGTSYTFQVQAHNSDANPSDWSSASAGVVPAGPPLQPAAPTVKKDPVSNLAPSATVSWTAPNGNGDNNMTYELTKAGDSKVLYSGTATSAQVTMAVSSTDQKFQVRAQNKAGWSTESPESNGVRAFQIPSAVTGLSVSATGVNNQVKITFGAADGKGALAGEIAYTWSANGRSGSVAVGGGTVTDGSAFPNGQNVSVAVYATSTVNGESAQGTSTSATVNAYGPPTSPSMGCSASGTSVSCSWSGGNANGRTTRFEVSGDWSTADGGASGSHNFGDVGYSATRSLCIKAIQDGGKEGTNNCQSARTQDPPPPPTVTVSKGASAVGVKDKNGVVQCSHSSCAYIVATTANFSAGVSCSVGFGIDWTQGANESKQSPNYYGYPKSSVTVTCSGGGQTASGSITW